MFDEESGIVDNVSNTCKICVFVDSVLRPPLTSWVSMQRNPDWGCDASQKHEVQAEGVRIAG